MISTYWAVKCKQVKRPSGRFFDTDTPSGLHKFSERFWIRNHDMLPEGFGFVLRAGILANGKLHNLDIPTKERTWDSTLSLFFDASRDTAGQFFWHLTRAQNYGGRTTTQVNTYPTTTSTISNEFDAQGGLMKPRATLSSEEQNVVIGEVIALAEHELLIDAVEGMRARRKADEAELGKFVVEGFRALGDSRYQHDLEQTQSHIDSIGFIALRPAGLIQ